MLNWKHVSALPWRQRNAEVQRAIRAYLTLRSEYDVFSTMQLAWEISHADAEYSPKLAQLMARLAPHMPGFARHDGPRIIRYGRQWQRWQWYGIAGGTNGTE